MTAYLIANVLETIDGDKLKEYSAANHEFMVAYGGKVVKGGPGTVIEGDITSDRAVIIEFPDMDSLNGWYNSTDYQPLKAMRLSAAKGFLIAVGE